MKRKLFWPLLIFLFAAVGFLFWKYIPQLPIALGYVARMTCSCAFGAGRDADEIARQNYFHSVLGYVDYELIENEKKVKAAIFGFAERIAQFRPGIGCVLINGDDNFNSNGFTSSKSFNDKKPFWPREKTKIFSFDQTIVQSTVESVFDKGDTLLKRTTGVVVVYRDSIIAEKYSNAFDQHTPQLGWSMTKSLMNAYIGLMVRDSLANTNQIKLFETWVDDRKNITLANLLQMNSGLSWEEDYTKVADATKMLYASDNVSTLAIQKELIHPIGSYWYYSSGTTNLISQWIRNVLKNDDKYKTYLDSYLFKPLNMENAWLEMDESGTYVGSSYSYATARDWAKFGLLYLHDGMYGSQEVLPRGWTDFTKTEPKGSNGNYGAQFWLNKGGEYPDCPRDMFYCDGYKGQFVYILPSHDLVIVRLGGEGKYFDGNKFIYNIIKSIDNH
jgi:CubicO group peptidase (beta-lactamase class C family)